MRLPKLLVLIICYLFRRRRGGRVAMSFSEIRMLRPAQPKPLSHHVIIMVRECACVWHRRRWHNQVVTLVRFLITGRLWTQPTCGSPSGGCTRSWHSPGQQKHGTAAPGAWRNAPAYTQEVLQDDKHNAQR